MGAQDPGVIAGRRTHLTPREIETLALVAAGHTYKETGALMFISPKTVETNVANAKEALGAKTTNHLIAMFVTMIDSKPPAAARGSLRDSASPEVHI